MNRLAGLIGCVFFSLAATAVSSFQLSTSVGIFRDFHQREHLPLFYSMRYEELYSGGVRTQFDLILNNDLAASDWQVMTSHANVFVPMKDASLQLGRQSFLGPFDFAILDGFQLPYSLSPTSGVRLFGGWLHPMDLADPEGTPLTGIEAFATVFSVHARIGTAWRQDQLKERTPWLSLSREFSELPWAPGLLAKVESDGQWNHRQSLAELTLNPWDGLFWSTMYSDRIPHKILADENYFLYRLLAMSPQKTLEESWHLELTDRVTLATTLRWMSYGNESGREQRLALIWADEVDQFQVPSLTHMDSYGGELWDVGSSWWHKINDRTSSQLEAAVAHFDKINGIKGWAYHLRGGVQWQAAHNFFLSGIGELERNHYFTFDMRALLNVTYYN